MVRMCVQIARRGHDLIDAIEALENYTVLGNRPERPLEERRIAAVELIPTCRARARHTVRIGDVVTTEVAGLAEAFHRLRRHR